MEGAPKHIGRYRVDGVLGRGGMGVVYAAWDPNLQRRIAIKVISDELESAGSRERLVREARAMAKLSHPNVLTVFEVGSQDALDFIAMELVDGMNLAEWLREGHGKREILRVFVEAGRGLAAAHAAELIHRDFKPHNVLVRRDGRAIVTDFGLARQDRADQPQGAPLTNADVAALVGLVGDSVDSASAPTVSDRGGNGDRRATAAPTDQSHEAEEPRGSSDALTRTGAILGTPGYMAPEQYRGSADARSDQFAFCVALWHALSGKPPFAGATGELVAAIERGPVGDLRGRERAILERGLRSDPRERWPSMDALLAQLAPAHSRSRWLAAGALAVVVGGGAVTYSLTHRDPAPALGVATTDPVRPQAPSPPPLLSGRVRHLTMDDGCEEFPAFTPDGNTVVYDARVGTEFALIALDLATGTKRKLVIGTAWSIKPAVSPDGTQVAYVHSADATEQTYVMPLAGGPPKDLGPGGLQPIWAPDGKAVWSGVDSHMQLVAIDTGKILRTIKPPPHLRAQEGVALPDGRLAFLMFADQGDQTGSGLALCETDGTWRWLVKASLLEAIAIAPDGKSLLVTHMTEANTHELWSVPLDGSKAGPIPGPVQPTYGLAVSARGDRLAWSDCEPAIKLATLAGRPLVLSTLPSGHWTDAAPAALPDGRHVVVVSDRDGQQHIWVVDLARSDEPRQLPAGEHAPGALALSPDGKNLYVTEDDGTLYVQPVDGSAPRRRVAGSTIDTAAPRRDGSIVITAGEAGHRHLSLIPAAGGEPTLLVADATLPAASPTTDDVYYLSNAAADRGAIKRLDAKGHTTQVAKGVPARRALVVSPDGKQLAALEDTDLTVLDLATGHVVAHYSSGGDVLTGVTWAGTTLVVSRAQFQGDLWLVER